MLFFSTAKLTLAMIGNKEDLFPVDWTSVVIERVEPDDVSSVYSNVLLDQQLDAQVQFDHVLRLFQPKYRCW